MTRENTSSVSICTRTDALIHLSQEISKPEMTVAPGIAMLIRFLLGNAPGRSYRAYVGLMPREASQLTTSCTHSGMDLWAMNRWPLFGSYHSVTSQFTQLVIQ